jgi:ribosomal protein S27AE
MTTPKCPKCGGQKFEMQEIHVAAARFRYNAVLCSACGVILAVHEIKYISDQVEQLAKKLGLKLD